MTTARRNQLAIVHSFCFLVLLLVGVFSLYMASIQEKDSLAAKLLDHLGAAFLIVGAISVYDKWVTQGEILEVARHLFRIAESCYRSGIVDFVPDSQQVQFADILAKNTKLSIVLNDGHKWFSRHFSEIESRFSSSGTATDVYLVDPDGSFLTVLAGKTGDTPGELRAKINRTISSLRELFSESERRGSLRIFFLRDFPAYAGFIGEKLSALTLYSTSNVRQVVPTLIFTNNSSVNSMYSFAARDVEKARLVAKEVFDSTKEVVQRSDLSG